MTSCASPISSALLGRPGILAGQYKCYYDENPIFSIEAVLKHKQVAGMRRKMLFTIFKYAFCSRDIQVLKYANYQVMTSYTQTNLIKYDEKRYLGRFVSEMFDSLQSTKCAPQFELNTFVTMATYWVPDHPNIKGISGHLQRSIFIFVNGASS